MERKVSLTILLMWFRPTAVGMFFLPITKPRRETLVSLSFAKISSFGWDTLQVFKSKTC